MYRLASLDNKPRSIVNVDGVRFGDGFVMIAGPCAVEDELQMEAVTAAVSSAGADLLRGGTYKPRTSPYSFQGLGDAGVDMIASASARHRIPAVVEALAERHVDVLSSHVAMIQIGARNMQNFALLTAAAKTGVPILLKRGLSATLDEVLCAAEYILLEGNADVVLCERGIRGFDRHTRNVFDLGGALRLKELTHLPVIVDPSHATGRSSLVAPLVLAAAAAGLDGAMVEVHPEPQRSLSDAEQALNLDEFSALIRSLQALRSSADRAVALG